MGCSLRVSSRHLLTRQCATKRQSVGLHRHHQSGNAQLARRGLSTAQAGGNALAGSQAPTATRSRGCPRSSSVDIGSIVRLQQQQLWVATTVRTAILDGDLEATWEDTRAGGDWRLSTQRATFAQPSQSQGVAVPQWGHWTMAVAVEEGEPGPRDRRQRDSCLSCQLRLGARRNTRSSSNRAVRRRADKCRARCGRDGRGASAGGQDGEQSCLAGCVGNSHRWREVAQTRRQPFGQHQSQVRYLTATVVRSRWTLPACPSQTLSDVRLQTSLAADEGAPA